MKENTINLQRNGNIVIQDIQSGDITINTNDSNDILQKLQQLNDTQIAVIKQLAHEQTGKLNDIFKTLLSGVMSRKNIVEGNISNVKSVTQLSHPASLLHLPTAKERCNHTILRVNIDIFVNYIN